MGEISVMDQNNWVNQKWGFYDGSQKKFEIKKDYIETMFPGQWQ